VAGQRVCHRLDDSRGPPFAPLARVATTLVEVVQLAKDGRDSVEERAKVLLACSRATAFLGFYCSLTGLSRHLDWGAGLSPYLCLRRLRLRQSGVTAEDMVQLLRCAPSLEAAVFVGEHLGGAEAALLERPPPPCSQLHSLELMDCNLSTNDATSLLQMPPRLRTAHLQAMDLRGLGTCLERQLPSLRELRALDCALSGADARGLLAHCPSLEAVTLCGNPLSAAATAAGTVEEGEGEEVAAVMRRLLREAVWPKLPMALRADFRHCGLGCEEEDAWRACFPAGADVEFSASAAATHARAGSGRVVFEDSSSSSEE